MVFPIKTCVVCGEEFELRPGKPGFANRCPTCSEPQAEASAPGARLMSAEERHTEARSQRITPQSVIRDMLYRGDS